VILKFFKVFYQLTRVLFPLRPFFFAIFRDDFPQTDWHQPRDRANKPPPPPPPKAPFTLYQYNLKLTRWCQTTIGLCIFYLSSVKNRKKYIHVLDYTRPY